MRSIKEKLPGEPKSLGLESGSNCRIDDAAPGGIAFLKISNLIPGNRAQVWTDFRSYAEAFLGCRTCPERNVDIVSLFIAEITIYTFSATEICMMGLNNKSLHHDKLPFAKLFQCSPIHWLLPSSTPNRCPSLQIDKHLRSEELWCARSAKIVLNTVLDLTRWWGSCFSRHTTGTVHWMRDGNRSKR